MSLEVITINLFPYYNKCGHYDGMLASGSCLLTDVADQLHEDSKKINTVDRLSKHLAHGIPQKALAHYLNTIRKWVP